MPCKYLGLPRLHQRKWLLIVKRNGTFFLFNYPTDKREGTKDLVKTVAFNEVSDISKNKVLNR